MLPAGLVGHSVPRARFPRRQFAGVSMHLRFRFYLSHVCFGDHQRRGLEQGFRQDSSRYTLLGGA